MASNGHADAYRVLAAKCISRAQKTDNTQSKLALLDMGKAWLLLAGQGDKNDHAPTLVYETPEPRQPIAQQQQQPQPDCPEKKE